MKKVSIVLAGGIGKRMHSKTSKVMHKICGREMLFYATDAVKNVTERVILVVSPHINSEALKGFEVVYQEAPLGTGDAVKKALPLISSLPDDGTIVIVPGDNPLIREGDISSLMDFHVKEGNGVTILAAVSENPAGLGRIVRIGNEFVHIVEESEATEEEKKIKEISTGIYIFRKDLLIEGLSQIDNKNTQGEYYLTDVLGIIAHKERVGIKILERKLPVYGVNNRVELSIATANIQTEIVERLMLEGVTFINPQTTSVDYFVKIGEDTTVYPFCILEGKTEIGMDCTLGPFVRITDSFVGKSTKIQYSFVRGSYIGEECSIGPFSSVRPENVFEKKVKIGSFVEVKKSKVSENSKVPHLSYIGDAIVGKDVNVGAGTITCNFSGLEGEKKNPTFIEDGVFIGSNSTLVAPIILRKGAYIAAGSVVTEEVPQYSLAVGRARQVNKIGWVKRRKD